MTRRASVGLGAASGIDKYLGTNFDKVKTVADNIDDVSTVADNLDNILDINESADKIDDLLENESDISYLADNLESYSIQDSIDLVLNQLVVDLPTVVANAATVTVVGQSIDDAILVKDVDYTVTGQKQITLVRDYPVGSVLRATQNISEDGVIVVTEGVSTTNRNIVNLAVGAVYGPYDEDGRTGLLPRLFYSNNWYVPSEDVSGDVSITSDDPIVNADGSILVATSGGNITFSKVLAETVTQETLRTATKSVTGLTIHPLGSNESAKVGDTVGTGTNALLDANAGTIYLTSEVISGPITDIDFDVGTATIGGVNILLFLLSSEQVNFLQGSAQNLLIRDKRFGAYATRVHVEPTDRIFDGTTSKQDWMFDPYEADPTNYRIASIFTEVGNQTNLGGENGRAVWNVKGAGQQWGIWPSHHFGFQDGARVPMKLFMYDTSDTEWRTPQKGLWGEGVAYNTDDYCLSNFKLYKAVVGGTSGSVQPSHSSGTASDGSIDWEFIRDFQASIAAQDVCVLFGDVDDMPLFGQFGIPVQYHGHTVHKNGFRDKWLKNDGTSLLAWTGVRNDSNSYQIEMADGSSTQVFEGWRRANNSALSLGTQVVSDNSASLDIATKEKITLSNTVATTVTAFTNGRVNQSFYIEATNSNTTIEHNAQIRLKGGVDLIITDEDILQFVRHSDGRYIQL